MRPIARDFSHLWPGSRESVLAPIFSKATYLRFPEDLSLIALEKNPETVIVVTSEADLFAIRPYLFKGFRHFVNRNRDDLSQELLASCLMIARPARFAQNPIPFFLSGFSDVQILADTERNFTMNFHDSTQKHDVLYQLEAFLAKNPKTRSLSDICIQSADELITNALYNAPVDALGERLYLNYDRQQEVSYPPDRTATLFACFSNDRITIGCEDTYGSLSKTEMFQYLRSKFSNEISVPNITDGGAGLGIKMIMENAANFYLFSEKNRRTIIAASFLLTGLKSNMSNSKHFHWSII